MSDRTTEDMRQFAWEQIMSERNALLKRNQELERALKDGGEPAKALAKTQAELDVANNRVVTLESALLKVTGLSDIDEALLLAQEKPAANGQIVLGSQVGA